MPERETGERGEQAWPLLGAEQSAEPGWDRPSSDSCEGPRAGLRYSPASGPCLSFRASDRCLTRKSCS